MKLTFPLAAGLATALVLGGAAAPVFALTNPADNPAKITVTGDDGKKYVDGQDTLPGYDDEDCTYIPGAWFDFANNRVRYPDGQSIPWTEWDRASGYKEWQSSGGSSGGGSSSGGSGSSGSSGGSSASGGSSSPGKSTSGGSKSTGSKSSSGTKSTPSSGSTSAKSGSTSNTSGSSGSSDASASSGSGSAATRSAAADGGATPNAAADDGAGEEVAAAGTEATPGATVGATPGATPGATAPGTDPATGEVVSGLDDAALVSSDQQNSGSGSAGLLILVALAVVGGLAVGGRSLFARFNGKGSAS